MVWCVSKEGKEGAVLGSCLLHSARQERLQICEASAPGPCRPLLHHLQPSGIGPSRRPPSANVTVPSKPKTAHGALLSLYQCKRPQLGATAPQSPADCPRACEHAGEDSVGCTLHTAGHPCLTSVCSCRLSSCPSRSVAAVVYRTVRQVVGTPCPRLPMFPCVCRAISATSLPASRRPEALRKHSRFPAARAYRRQAPWRRFATLSLAAPTPSFTCNATLSLPSPSGWYRAVSYTHL